MPHNNFPFSNDPPLVADEKLHRPFTWMLPLDPRPSAVTPDPPTGQDPNPDNWSPGGTPPRPDWRTHPEAYELWCQRYG